MFNRFLCVFGPDLNVFGVLAARWCRDSRSDVACLTTHSLTRGKCMLTLYLIVIGSLSY